jgi:serine/threonine-protein kinase RsbW
MTTLSRIALPAALENLHGFVAFVRDAAISLAVEPGRIPDIELALEEALVNIINHAYKGQRPGQIEVDCIADGKGLITIRVIDWGIPFNVLAAPRPDLTPDLSKREPGGLGIHLMKRLMDNVTYSREGERNILEFQVRLNPEGV